MEMPGQKSLKEIILNIANYYELKPSLIQEFKNFINTVTVQSMQLKLIRKNVVSEFLQQFKIGNNNENNNLPELKNFTKITQNCLESTAYCRLVAKLVATQASYSLPFYLPISSKIASAVNDKDKNNHQNNHNHHKNNNAVTNLHHSQYGGSTTQN